MRQQFPSTDARLDRAGALTKRRNRNQRSVVKPMERSETLRGVTRGVEGVGSAESGLRNETAGLGSGTEPKYHHRQAKPIKESQSQMCCAVLCCVVFDALCGVQCAAEAGPLHLHISFIRQFVLCFNALVGAKCFFYKKAPTAVAVAVAVAVAGHKHDHREGITTTSGPT